jgi:hypothetical protein
VVFDRSSLLGECEMVEKTVCEKGFGAYGKFASLLIV